MQSCTGGLDVIRKETWPSSRTTFGVRLCWELEEPIGPKGLAEVGRALDVLFVSGELRSFQRGSRTKSMLCNFGHSHRPAVEMEALPPEMAQAPTSIRSTSELGKRALPAGLLRAAKRESDFRKGFTWGQPGQFINLIPVFLRVLRSGATDRRKQIQYWK